MIAKYLIRRAVGPAALLTALVVTPVYAAREPDAWITTKVKIALIVSPDVSAVPIDVDTYSGRVTLHGKVVSKEERAQAEALAKSVAGVSGVRNLLQVVPESRRESVEIADAELQRRVEAALGAEPRLANSRIHVKSVNRGVVLLNGSASTLSDHLLALEITRRTPGVRQVASEIESPERFGDRELWYDDEPAAKNSAIGDTWITARTKFKFMTDPDIPAGDINVDTRDGSVTLFGTVPSPAVRDKAVRVAKSVAGVKRVENELIEERPADRKRQAASDHDLESAISSALTEAALPGADLHVEVKASVARLTGTVKRPTDRYDAVLIARATDGVSAVRDDIELKP